MPEKKLTVSASPHVRSAQTVSGIMLNVIIALIPALAASIWLFGPRVLLVCLVTVGTCMLSEYLSRRIMKRSNTLGDLSAVVTGLLLAFNLPVSIPLWQAAIGSVVAIVVVKQLFGGIGQNFVNPAITGRIILMVSFPTAMTTWIKPLSWLDKGADAVTAATPLTMMTKGGELSDELPSLVDMLIGIRGGSLGETCAVALIIGGIYMMIRKIISPAIPLSFIGTVAVIMLIAGKGDFRFVAYQLLSGGLMLGAFFMATDYTTSDNLYFEPLTVEDVMNVIELEQPMGIVVSLGGQTAINLAPPLDALGVPIIGTDVAAIDRAENRDSFEKVMEKQGIPQPKGLAVTDIEEGVRVAASIGYPVLVRPSFVLGGRAMQIVANEESLRHYLQTAVEINTDQPVLVDKYIMGKELEVDAICDGTDVFIPGIMEHVERTGVHSGDSISIYPTFSVSQAVKDKIIDYTVKLGTAIGIVGLYNIQFIADSNDDVYVIEVNPRSSRTVPFLSKATSVPMAHIATQVILGHSLKEQGITEVYPTEKKRWYVKAPAFSFSKLKGMDTYLSPEMKSTGEAIGYDKSLTRALYKALQSSGLHVSNYGTVLVTIADQDKPTALPLIRRFYDLGFNIEATEGTAKYLKDHGIRTRVRQKLTEDDSDEILMALRQGHIAYVINTIDINHGDSHSDGSEIRRAAVENNVTMFTSLDTVKVLLDVLEEITLGVSTIDAE